jgi:hypothetical protein
VAIRRRYRQDKTSKINLEGDMPDTHEAGLLFPLVASIARDLDSAGTLSQASRKAIWNFIVEHRDELGGEGTSSTNETRAAMRLLEGVAPAADG